MTNFSSEVSRLYREDGSLEAETVRDGDRVFMRRYHVNGKLGLEIPLEGKLVNGVVRQWDEEGRLLGSYELTMGTGRAAEWYSNGLLKGTTDMLDGMPNGRIQFWDENGKLFSSRFTLAGQLVSISKYREALRIRPNYPLAAANLDEALAQAGKAPAR